MADVFLSYAREDRGRIAALAAALEAEGFSVWWDRDIATGEAFSKTIERELNAAKAVIVAWSTAAHDSEWVKDEASFARRHEKLLPVRLDGDEPPLGFQQFQSTDLSAWRGAPDAEALQPLMRALRQKVTGAALDKQPAASSETSRPQSNHFALRMGIAAIAALTVAAGAILLFRQDIGDGRETDEEAQLNVGEEDAAASIEAGARVAAQGVGLAVLPFVNMSSDPEQEHFADGLTEELLNWLANVEGLNVPGRTSSFRFKGKLDDMRVIGEALGVRYLLEGSVRHAGDELRITAQLIEAETGYHLWSETYDRKFADIFAVQDEIARIVVTELLGAIPESGMANPAAVAGVEPAAHEAYLAGRALWSARRPIEAYEKFREAIDIDPDHALAQAYFAVTNAFALHNGFDFGGGPEVQRASMNAALTMAVALEPYAPDVLFAQAWVLEFGAEPIAGARHGSNVNERSIRLYKRAVRANPRHVEALHALSRNASTPEEKIELLKRVLAIDPGVMSARLNLADNYFARGDRADAFQLIDQTYVLYPDAPRIRGAGFAWDAGDMTRAGEYLFDRWDSVDADPFSRLMRASILADLGATDEARYLMKQELKAGPDDDWRILVELQELILARDTEGHARVPASMKQDGELANFSNLTIARVARNTGEPERALDLLLARRPYLLSPDGPTIDIGHLNSTVDPEAYLAALALKDLGRVEDAATIWKAALEAANGNPLHGWANHMNRAVAHAGLGEKDAAIEALQSAYEEGFRFIYSHQCYICIDDSFYASNGYFSSIYEEPEFRRLVDRIEKDNAETLARLDARYGVLERVRAMMAQE